MQDLEYMRLAISLARATIGQTSPNPSVGAVLIKDGRLIGSGAHLKAGTPHAEVHAIQAAGENARDGILYVTLEPCSHFGKTPPCADLIIKSGIKKVFVATLDPNPLVAGNGIKKLKEAGIEVHVGLGEDEAKKLNHSFFHFIKTNTPFVTIKAAVSLDGKTAAKTGDSKWITSPESRLDVHQLRHEHDAILVGINTVLNDDPLLTTRRPQGGKNPIRIVLDTHLKTPIHSQLVQDQSAKTIIFTSKDVDSKKVEELTGQGVEIISFHTTNIPIKEMLKVLGEKKIMSLLVEGGSEIHASFIEEGAFQQVILYIAPKIIGGRSAIPFVGGEGPELVEYSKKLEFVSFEKVGPDLKLIAKPLVEED
ncbi:bifunctional diaminohydroxyphosphoribosylaminopyrimidine deaminase/5-amino-6-(5-phosphoribosylamino)uracil reductase RibD [Cytobacillus sp. FJAT-54145]|uniref:Riboflavin biosynthesis protein RibD n=1 Tax=Cytobacillus spartinae TaxID=3299023 RepID=A0ABW6KCW6_9BACI